ncbi:MAG: hypothetical protein OEY43_11110 [Gammaproteobacteria bacterium]|nr:hypothetical protein [Gammaproteobacteria bacterium]
MRWLLVSLCLLSANCFAFYVQDGKDYALDMRGMVRAYGSYYRYDNSNNALDNTDTALAAIGRLMIDLKMPSGTTAELNVYQTYIPDDLLASDQLPLDVERSSLLEWSLSDASYSHLAFDRLNIKTSWDNIDLTLGRQSINLATTFYFTPNDLFAPFAAQNFYRVYKPGVDALRVELNLGDFSQLELISVLGFERDTTTDTGWSNSPEASRGAHLVRLSTVIADQAWSFIIAGMDTQSLMGISFQGEMLDWLGIRMEGHVADRDDQSRVKEISMGLEHRWENSMDLRLEYFYHGAGGDRVINYGLYDSYYLARRYLAVGLSYQLSPLMTIDFLWNQNLVDYSDLYAFHALYSLADESELAINLSLPRGEKNDDTVIMTEFGSYPATISLELRHYF